MLRDLTIQNYRCFKDFHIDGLARVNLIVGMNNSGKTSLLEAIYLLVNQGGPGCLVELLEKRGEVVEHSSLGVRGEIERQIYYQVRHLFYGHQPSLEQIIDFRTQTKEHPPTQIYLEPGEQQESSSDNLSINNESPFKLVFPSGAKKISLPVNYDGLIKHSYFNMFIQMKQFSNSFISGRDSLNDKSLFLTTNNLSFDKLSALWNRITLTPKEDQVVDALRILEKTLERISFTSQSSFNSGILVRLRGQYPIPIGTMGEGMRRIMTLTIAAVTVENGFLLVDEIETGLYYETQTDMWRLILETAQRWNVQVFATTHSWDCICAFQEALDQLEDRTVGKLFRLSQRDDKIRPVAYTADELAIAVPHSIEVR